MGVFGNETLEWKGLYSFAEFEKCPAGVYGDPQNPMWQYPAPDEKGEWSAVHAFTYMILLVPMLFFWVYNGVQFLKNIDDGAGHSNFGVYGYTREQLMMIIIFTTFGSICFANIAYGVPGFNGTSLLVISIIYFVLDFYQTVGVYRNTYFTVKGVHVSRSFWVQFGDFLIVVALLVFTTHVYEHPYDPTHLTEGMPNHRPDFGPGEKFMSWIFFTFFTLGMFIRTICGAHNMSHNMSGKRGAKNDELTGQQMFPTTRQDMSTLNPDALKALEQGVVLVAASYEYFFINFIVYLIFGFGGVAVAYKTYDNYHYFTGVALALPITMVFSMLSGMILDGTRARGRSKRETDVGLTAMVYFVNFIFICLLTTGMVYFHLHLEHINDFMNDKHSVFTYDNFLWRVKRFRFEAVWLAFGTLMIPMIGLCTFMFTGKDNLRIRYHAGS